MRSIPRLCLSLWVATSFLWGEALARAASPSRSSPGPGLTDLQLEERIREAIGRSKAQIQNFQVRVRNGVAVLEGTANLVQHKALATRLARRAGARQVENRIQLTEAARQRLKRSHRSQPRRVQVQFRPRSQSPPRKP